MPVAPAPPICPAPEIQDGPALIDALLAEQQETAVERFARFHDDVRAVHRQPYRHLMPLSRPREGEQYAFEVDLDACSGCKACVTACHNLNGLEESETWRNVGLLLGGTDGLPVLQHVTTACHHCIDPACLTGCPVKAYEKDPATGIVRHLDDQCIGCQYCIFKCPYDVPVYSRTKGIVRKCDMCHDRLSVGEAPACVQACPNGAIRIRHVDRQEVISGAESNQFLPAAPEPGYTLPTTIYRTERALPRNLLPADYYSAQRQHAHLSLVWMLILTQMSVGAFVIEQWLPRPRGFGGAVGEAGHVVAALLLGLAGLSAAVFHLGRPLYAYRALLGLRTSWLSREILAFGLYALFATGYAVVALLGKSAARDLGLLGPMFGMMAALAGCSGVLCSVMIYVDTRRPLWRAAPTTLKFVLTSVVLGLPLVLSYAAWSAWTTGSTRLPNGPTGAGGRLYGVVIAAVVAKLLVELSLLAHLQSNPNTPHKRAATLMIGDLSRISMLRLFFAIVGGVLLPLVILAEKSVVGGHGFQPLFACLLTTLVLATLIAGEFLERYTFFAASVAPKMPGVQAA